LGIQQRLATARHQSANGQAEVQVRIVKNVLRKFANYSQDNWSDVLPLVEFSLNNSISSSTGYSPFYLFNGFEPRVFPDEFLVEASGKVFSVRPFIVEGYWERFGKGPGGHLSRLSRYASLL